jgi:hypothetical protein
MPKTSVHKYDDALFREGEVWLAEYFGIPSPTGDSICAEEHDHPQFGILVPTAAD